MTNRRIFATVLMLTFLAAGAVYAETWTTYNNSNTGGAIGNNTIKGAAVESGTRWFGTNGGGVAKYDGTTWTKYTTSAGLGNNTVRASAVDSSSNKWFATAGGLAGFEPSRLPRGGRGAG